MPSKTTKIKASAIKAYQAVIGGPQAPWKIGVISLVAADRIPAGAVVQARNMMQTQDGVWQTRWGSQNYGEAFTGPVTGFQDFITIDEGVQTQWYMMVDNGTMKYAKDGGSWTSVADHTVDMTNWTNMLMYENKLLVCNGVDAFGYVDLTTMDWVSFVSVSAPQTLANSLINLSSGDYNLYYQVTAYSLVGETIPTAASTANVNLQRNAWYNPNATNIVTSAAYGVSLTWDAPATGADAVIGYNIYLSDGISGVSYFLDSVGPDTLAYTDWGFAAINDFIQVPTSDTTSSPEFTWIALSDNRLYACGDPNNPNRIYFAGTGSTYALAFNPAVGGGYVDILPGGPELPYVIKQFRNGQGNPMTTILQSQPNGYGSMWHLQVSSDTIGNTVVQVPTVVQAMGTFGTTAPRSLVETNQNVYYYSGGPAGIYSNGSVPTLFNVLATNEVSLLVRPDIKLITLESSPNICGIEYDRKLWYSVPYGAPENNRIMIYDLEKENWNPFAFDFGIAQFIHYRDNSGTLHLLGIPVNPTAGNFIIEFNQEFLSDNGVAFEANLQTGLIHPTPDHVQWAQVRYVFYEFSSPQGEITVIYSGTLKNPPTLEQLQLDTFTAGGTESFGLGFSSFGFSTTPFSYDAVPPTITTELSQKKRMLINKLLNNWQASVTSSNVNSSWTLNQIIVQGFIIPTAAPSSWILN